MLAFLILKYNKSVQVFIKDVSVLRYAHDISYFKAVFDSKLITKPDLWAVSGHIPEDMRGQHIRRILLNAVIIVSGHVPDDMRGQLFFCHFFFLFLCVSGHVPDDMRGQHFLPFFI
jgi:hypothetical protein